MSSCIYHIHIFLFSIFLLKERLVIFIAAWYHYFFLIFPLRTYFAGQEIVCLRLILFSVLIVEASFSSFAISRRYPSSSACSSRVSFYRIMKRFFLFLCIREFSSALNHCLTFYELYRQSNNWVISLLLPLYRILALSVTVVIHRFADSQFHRPYVESITYGIWKVQFHVFEKQLRYVKVKGYKCIYKFIAVPHSWIKFQCISSLTRFWN